MVQPCKCLFLSFIRHSSGPDSGYWWVKTATSNKTSGVKHRWHHGYCSVFAYFQFQVVFPPYKKMLGSNTKTRYSISWNRFSNALIFVTHLLFGPVGREAGVWKRHLYETKDRPLDPVSLSGFKEQWHNTVVAFPIYLLQRTVCVHTAKLAYHHQQGYIQTGNSCRPVPPRALLGRVLTGAELCRRLYRSLQYE